MSIHVEVHFGDASRLAVREMIVQKIRMGNDAIDRLSDMQIACLRLVAELKKTEQIADDLGISPSTVNTHIERAIARLQVPNRRAAARLVVEWDAQLIRQPRPAPAIVTVPITPPSPEKSPTEESPLLVAPDPGPSSRSSSSSQGASRNDLTVPYRLLLALLLLVLLCLGIGGLGAAIEQLSHWRAGYPGPRR